MTYCWWGTDDATCLLAENHDGDHEWIPYNKIGITLASRLPESEPDPAYEAALAHAKRIECCGDDAWRGRLCQYHQGFEDGYDVAQAVNYPIDFDTIDDMVGL